MEVYRLDMDGRVVKVGDLPKNERLVCAFGCFDGVHLGHQALLSAAVSDAERLNLENGICGSESGMEKFVPAVWTFLSPVSKPWVISVPERLSRCGMMGIRYAVCQPFEDVRTMSPEAFVDSLVNAVGLRYAVCGFNFRFGYKGVGDPSRLSLCLSGALGRIGAVVYKSKNGVDALTVVDEVCALGGTVSSTRIRGLLAQGEVESVETLLGRPYSLSGVILPGKQIGRTISRPTANLIYSSDQLVPKRGVYYTYCRLKGRCYRAVTNVGYRPTVNSDVGDVTCEAHLLDFSESVYGECVEIIFVHYARAEIAFSSVEELSAQITEDVRKANEYFENNPLI